MCRVFIPEDYFACGDGSTDDLAAFNAMIAAMSNGDVAQLAGKTYSLGGTLHVNKRIAIVGEILNPHYGVHRSRLRFPANVLGLRLLRGATIRDLAIDGAAVNGEPGADSTAHGIWCRRTVHLENIFVQRFGGHGVSLDTRTIERVTSSVSVAVDSSNLTIATAMVNDNTGLLSILADMEIELHGYTVSTPSSGGIARSATASAVEFELPGAPSGQLAGLTRTIDSASVTDVASIRQCTVDVGVGHGLRPNMHISTTDAIDTPILSVHRDGRRVTFALTTGGPGPAQGDTLTVTRGLLRTIQNCDHWQAENVRCNGNRGHGWHTLGARSNAGCAINIDCTSNYQSGIHEESFLGNTYVACHTSENSRSTVNPGDPVWPSYNKPREADNNRSKFYNCYSEGSAPAEVWYPASVFAPGPGNWIGDGLGGAFDVSYGRPTLFVNRDRAPGRDANLPLNRVDFNVGGPRGAIFSFEAAADERTGAQSQPYRLQFLVDPPNNAYLHWFALQHLTAGRPTPLAFSGVRTVDASGGLTNVGQIWFPNGFYYGRGQAKQNSDDRGPYRATTYRETGPAPATRAVAWGAAPPSGNQGTWARGDLVWNANADVGRAAGWMCIEASSQASPAGRWAALPALV
ncbi:MAG TPA: hypothetical protein VE078_19330 [Thermoanaerobaculia bacterium]|nr:hypothetical protein [Thermoanaerobaculia bacterium]